MQLPFTHDQFLDVFAAYNQALWPAAALLWLVTAGVLLRWTRSGKHGREVAAMLAVHWAWSAIAYHAVFFRQINPAAVAFAVLFVAEAALLVWLGVVRGRVAFAPARAVRGAVAGVVIGYAMLYPGLGLLFGLSYPRAPTFGVPCPTTILTAGLLLLAGPRDARILGLIPATWTVVGGSAAFLLEIRADLMLVVAGVLLVAVLVAPKALGAAQPG